MKRLRALAAIGVCALITATAAYGAGLWSGMSQLGGAGGPTVFQGTEAAPFDLYATSTTPVATVPSTAFVSAVQLGQGPMIDLTTVGTAQTIPNNTPWYFLDGAQGSALTVTMPAVAVEGQIQRVVCESATVGAVTVAANTGQTLKNNPGAACAVGTTYSWRYQASNTTWYRF